MSATDKVRRDQTEIRVPPSVQAQVIGLRKLGFSYRQIAEKTGRDKNTVMKILHSPEAQEELAANANQILSQYRQRALAIVPEALEALEELIAGRDRTAVTKLLFGTQVLAPRSDQRLEHTVQEDPFESRSEEELKYFIKHLKWPTPEQLEERKQQAKQEK